LPAPRRCRRHPSPRTEILRLGASPLASRATPIARGALRVMLESFSASAGVEKKGKIMTGPAIVTEKLTRRFGGLTAVDGMDLTVAAGQFFGFLGPNGAGKSTTIKMLTGLLAPTSGRVQLLGLDFSSDGIEVKRQIGVVPEGMGLFDRLTGAEYLNFVGRMYGLDRTTTQRRAVELLDFMQLADRPRSVIADYSHGMQKKLALAAAVIHGPRILFLDEPFEGVDALAAGALKALLGRMTERGVTIFLTSHVLEIVERLCSHVAIIHKGRLVAQGSLKELRAGVAGEEGRPTTLEEIFVSIVGQGEGDRPQREELSWLM
jgi:ABC-2 type transport system ATP-binding protein